MASVAPSARGRKSTEGGRGRPRHRGACDLCSDCVRVGRPTLGHALRAGRPHPCERLEAYYSCDAPEGSIAAGDDIGTLEALEDFSVATDVSQLEVLLLARARAYAIINKVTA